MQVYEGENNSQATRGLTMKRKHVKKIYIAVAFAIIAVSCSLAVLNSEWMQKKYGYGQDAIGTTEMLKEAYRRNAEGFDALVHALCEYHTSGRLRHEEPRPGYEFTGGRLYYEDHRLFQLVYDENEGESISLSLEDSAAQEICDAMENLAGWDAVYITFITDGTDDTTAIRSVDFSMMLNTAGVPWSKSYVEINMRCCLNGRPAADDIRFSGGDWLSDCWVIVSHGLV